MRNLHSFEGDVAPWLVALQNLPCPTLPEEAARIPSLIQALRASGADLAFEAVAFFAQSCGGLFSLLEIWEKSPPSEKDLCLATIRESVSEWKIDSFFLEEVRRSKKEASAILLLEEPAEGNLPTVDAILQGMGGVRLTGVASGAVKIRATAALLKALTLSSAVSVIFRDQ